LSDRLQAETQHAPGGGKLKPPARLVVEPAAVTSDRRTLKNAKLQICVVCGEKEAREA